MVSHDGFGRPVPRQRAHSPHTQGVPPTFRGGIHLFIPPTAIEPVPSSSCHPVAYRCGVHCREFAGTVPQYIVLNVVPVTGAAFSGITMDPIEVRLSFPAPTVFWYVVDMCDIGSIGMDSLTFSLHTVDPVLFTVTIMYGTFLQKVLLLLYIRLRTLLFWKTENSICSIRRLSGKPKVKHRTSNIERRESKIENRTGVAPALRLAHPMPLRSH